MYWPLLRWRMLLFVALRRGRAGGLLSLAGMLLGLLSVLNFPATVTTPPPAPAVVVQRYFAALDAQNLDAVMALFARDAVIRLGSLRGEALTLSGPAAIGDFYRRYYLVQTPTRHQVRRLSVDGDTVLVDSTVRWGQSAVGVDETERLVVRSGKIVALADAAS